MVKTASTMLPLGTTAPPFSLPNVDGKIVSIDDFKTSRGLVVIFMCNHCPFVKHLRAGLAQFAKDYQSKGVAVVGISSNDVGSHPDDSPAKMAEEHKSAGYTFPYLYDGTQDVAKAYKAACTPDFFVFDQARRGDPIRNDEAVANEVAVVGDSAEVAAVGEEGAESCRVRGQRGDGGGFAVGRPARADSVVRPLPNESAHQPI